MNYRRRIWISGVNGRLGQELLRHLDPLDAEILTTDRDTVDITNGEEVMLFAERNRPQIIINCSALTDPEYCEKHPEEAFRVNGLGARNMAVAANRILARLVHLSTDDVFDGSADTPYREFDPPAPDTYYGKSKLFGEQYVRDFSMTYFIIRSSWLYGTENNRVAEILNEARKTGAVSVAKDQFAAPTSAWQLATFITTLMETTAYGVYHAVCKGACSRKEFAEKVLELANVKAEVLESEEVFNRVYRPDYSVLDDFLLELSGIYEFPTWEEELERFMKKEGYCDKK